MNPSCAGFDEVRRRRAARAAALVVFAAAALCSLVPAAADEARQSAPAWDKDVVRLFQTLPVLDEGRIKPLDTYAGFKLLKLNGRRSCTTPDGRTLAPTEWLLDTLFFPEAANTYAVFSIDTSDVVVSLGLVPHDKKRDRYSYNELKPGRDKMMEFAELYGHIADKDRSAVQRQILNLAHNFMEYEDLAAYAGFTRKKFTLQPCEAWPRIFQNATEVSLSEALAKAPQLYNEFLALKRDKDALDDARKTSLEAITKLLGDLDGVRKTATALALFPASNKEDKEWMTAADMVMKAFEQGPKFAPELGILSHFEAVGQNLFAPDKLGAAARALSVTVEQTARDRGEYAKIPLEVTFYKGQFFYRSLVFYIIAFLLVAVAWMIPNNRALAWVNVAAVILPTVLLAIGITFRCIIRGRPPVTTLYETVLFTTFVAVVVCLFIELVNRQRIAISMGAILGVIGVFIANKYEAAEGTDTMPSMVAVLDTNFWLATHVTTISMGYAAGLLSGAMAHLYIIGRALGFKKKDPDFYNTLTRMIYGVFCFGFFFAFVGTLLGGVWADQSWGRFWGWDPKENGALLICLWMLAALHARLGGYIRELGFNIAAVICGMVVAFSWWGVNLLGVGLHSYGFTSGAMTSLIGFWAVEFIVVLAGLVVWARQRWMQTSSRHA